MQRSVGRVEDYTNICLIMGLVNLFWVLMLIRLTLGWGAVLLAALVLNWAISRLGLILAARHRAALSRGKPGF